MVFPGEKAQLARLDKLVPKEFKGLMGEPGQWAKQVQSE
jgi:hypothetical protein